MRQGNPSQGLSKPCVYESLAQAVGAQGGPPMHYGPTCQWIGSDECAGWAIAA